MNIEAMKATLGLLTLCLLTLTGGGEGARILALFPLWAPSHHTVLRPVMKALALAGHEVVVYSPFPLENPPPTYKNVFVNTTVSVDLINEHLVIVSNVPRHHCFDIWYDVQTYFNEIVLQNDEYQKLLHTNEKFDVVFTEPYIAQHVVLTFSSKFNVPTIGVHTFSPFTLLSWQSGNSLSLSSIPNTCFSFSNGMSFTERFLNSYGILRDLYVYFNDYLPSVEKKVRKYVSDVPPLADLTTNLSLMFINDHLTAGYARPWTPNMIPISGIHLSPEKPLPQEMKRFLDEAKHGAILFSQGTLVADDLKPKEYFDMLINVFKKLPQRVLWKTKKQGIKGLPDNVMVVNWVPQQDFLTHPNCVLFITHCGVSSQIETIHAGVPVVGIPAFADQFQNAGFLESQGVGVKIEPQDVSEETLSAAVNEVLSNKKYRENMKRLSKIFKDRPMSPAESVVYWTEYVIRHGGAPHLRPASTQLSWYQRFLLDILAAVLAVACTTALLLYLLLKKILSLLLRIPRKDLSPLKKTN